MSAHQWLYTYLYGETIGRDLELFAVSWVSDAEECHLRGVPLYGNVYNMGYIHSKDVNSKERLIIYHINDTNMLYVTIINDKLI